MILELFSKISSIARCSKNSDNFVVFLRNFATDNDFEIFVDSAKNVLCKKRNSYAKLALQAHYDMVCLEDGKLPTVINNGEILTSLDSTLGADNGMACAYMLALMQENYDLEYLFTSDEEIGLIGANNLNLELQASYLLNLDSENENEICIGCAGGVDIVATFDEMKIENVDEDLYEVLIGNLPGGHSGIDIDKNIPNAIKLVAQVVKNCDGRLLDFVGGERINSIPKNAKAIIASKNIPILSHENMKINKLTKVNHCRFFEPGLLEFLALFQNGILEFNKKLDVVETSVNLAKINCDEFGAKVELSLRSMNLGKLERETKNIIELLKAYNFDTKSYGKYVPWEPEINDFALKIKSIFEQNMKRAEFKVIHAGLECAVLQKKFPNIKIASIGPSIYFPHSHKEYIEIKSAYFIFDILKEIVKVYS